MSRFIRTIDLPFICLSFVGLIINNSLSTACAVLIWTLVLNALMCYRSRHNWYLLIVGFFIIWANYSILIANYFSEIDSMFVGWKNDPIVMIPAANIIMIFSLILLIFMPYDLFTETKDFFDKEVGNPIIVIGSLIVLAYILVYGFTRPTTVGERGTPSTIFEYSIIIFIVAFYYSNRTIEKTLLSIMMLLFVLENTLYGGRVTALQLIICWFLVFLACRTSLVKVLPFLIIGLLVFVGIGSDRANYILGIESFKSTIEKIYNNKLTFDTSYAAFYTSGTFLKTELLLSVGERLHLFGRYLLSIVGGGKVADSNLAEYTRKIIYHYMGGVLPFFAHFYLGYIGVLGIGVYVTTVFRTIYKKLRISGLAECMLVYLTCSTPRWYLYSPAPLMRGILIMTIVYGACYVFDSLFNRSKVKNSDYD